MQTQKLKEKIGYSIINRESEIDNLIMWINESKNDYDKSLIKEDLRFLMSLSCDSVYTNDNTNEYIPIN